MSLRSASIVLALLLALSSQCMVAQTQAVLTGRVFDESGAVIVGASVTATNTNTGTVTNSKSNAAGIYHFPFLAPGPYQLACENPGFKTYTRTEIILETAETLSIDIKMQLGSTTESLTVTGEVPLLQTENSTQGQFMERASVINMPVESRRSGSLVRLMGGVAFKSEGSIEQTPSFSMNGGRSQDQMWTLDGSSVQDIALGGPQNMMNPPSEALQEFRAVANGYNAEFGRAAGGMIIMTTRSGTNKYHGAAYEFLRNDAPDTRTFFAPSKAPLRYNIFGGSAGGPIRHDKTFFFANYEGARRRDGLTFANNTVPTAAEMNGDFSAIKGLTIKDPLTGQPFAGNIIPSSRMDPIGRKVAALYPTPNVSYDPSKPDANNYVTNVSDQTQQDVVTARLDHQFGDRDNLYLRFVYSYTNQWNDNVFPNIYADYRAEWHGSRQYNGTANWVHNFTPSLFNELRLGLVNRASWTIFSQIGSNMNQQLGIQGVDPTAFPYITLSGYSSLGATKQLRDRGPSETVQPVDSVTWVHGKHQVKFGGEYRFSMNVDRYQQQPGGEFDFSDRVTGNAVASLLLGWTYTAKVITAPKLVGRTDYYGLYIQDTWKATNNLTLNLGLRWDLDTPRWDRNNVQSGFNPSLMNPVSNTLGIVTFAGLFGTSKYAHNFDYNNFGPRIGFAYRLGDKWAIRGGAGIFYDGEYGFSSTRILTVGFGTNGSFSSPDGGTTPAFLFYQGMPTAPPYSPSVGFGAVAVGQKPNTSPEFIAQDHVNPYSEQWNLAIQRELKGNIAVEAAYIANMGHSLSGPAVNINQIALVDGHGPAKQDQTLRPYPQFNNVTLDTPSWGASSYNALNIKLEKRFSGGLNLMAAYTWSKFLDNVMGGDDLNNTTNSGYTQIQRHNLDKTYSGSDIPSRFVMTMVYDLPFGKGRHFDPGSQAFNAFFGAWELGINTEIRSGTPWGVVMVTDTSNTYAAANRPNLLSNPNISHDSTAAMLNQYFNTGAFQAPAAGYFGNAARNLGHGPGMIEGDVSLNKRWPITERLGLQFRVDCFNILNHANFANPATSMGAGDFGTIKSTLLGSTGRMLQLNMRLEF